MSTLAPAPPAPVSVPAPGSAPGSAAHPLHTLDLARELRRRHLRACIGDAALFWLASRLVLAVFTYLALAFAAGNAGTDAHAALSLPNALSRWNSWDGANFYDKIALHGYPTSDKGMAAFFPLYPLLLRGALTFTGSGAQSVMVAGLLVTNGALLLALIGLALLVGYECDTSRTTRLTALHLALAYPLAFFLTAPGGDALFLACAVWTLYAARRGWWWLAAGAALFAGLDRLTALVLVAPLLWEYGRQHGAHGAPLAQRWRSWLRLRAVPPLPQVPRMLAGRIRPAIVRPTIRGTVRAGKRTGEALAVATAAPLGVGLFFAWLDRVYGTPAVFFSIEAGYFNHHLSWPWQVAGDVWHDWQAVPFFSYGMARGLIDTAPLLGALALALAAALGWGMPRRLAAVYVLYAVGVLWVSSAAPIVCGGGCFPSDSLTSVGRYLTAAFPLLLPLVFWSRRRPWLAQALISGGALLQAGILVWFLLRVWIV